MGLFRSVSLAVFLLLLLDVLLRRFKYSARQRILQRQQQQGHTSNNDSRLWPCIDGGSRRHIVHTSLIKDIWLTLTPTQLRNNNLLTCLVCCHPVVCRDIVSSLT